eukprot:TRINITY_DN1369_c0_g1_i1.p1 TRINITY_DN1369_c0_g1~~TRINITY_DN1369_c0_g1_i1.p1  ORF type:complete len:393 (+),score=152.65 TRINITY_DN1369_c0_g1_i1:42-1220(+)
MLARRALSRFFSWSTVEAGILSEMNPASLFENAMKILEDNCDTTGEVETDSDGLVNTNKHFRSHYRRNQDQVNPAIGEALTEDESGETLLGKAVHMLRLAAAENDENAMTLLGNICLGDFKRTLKYETSIDAAAQWYEKAAEANSPDACYNLGILYGEGRGDLEGSLEKSRKYFEKAAALGDLSAQLKYGSMLLDEIRRTSGYLEGKVDEEKENNAVQIVEEAGVAGVIAAWGELAGYFQDKGDSENMTKYLMRGLDAECSECEYRFGCFLMESDESDDWKQAQELFEKAAEKEHPEACLSSGAIYFHGLGGEKSYEKAFERYQQAADLGYLPAWKNLASMYLHGWGVTKNEDMAAFLLKFIHEHDPEAGVSFDSEMGLYENKKVGDDEKKE